MSRSAIARIVGFIIGGTGPFLLGISAYRGFEAYAADMEARGEFVCGLPAIVPLMLFFVVTPVCGLIGAAVGPCFAWLVASHRPVPSDELPDA